MVFRKGGKITSRDRVKWEGIDLDCRDETMGENPEYAQSKDSKSRIFRRSHNPKE